VIPRRPLAIVVLVATLLASCSRRDERQLQQQRAAEQQRRQLQAQCQRDRRQLPPLLEAFTASRARVAAIEAEAYAASAPPAPLDPDEQRRLAIYDQEIEQEQYDQRRAAWEEQEQQRRASWQRERAARLEAARSQAAAAAAALRRAYPDMLTSSDPPQLLAAPRDRRLTCAAGVETP
jgi:hypothetical protein